MQQFLAQYSASYMKQSIQYGVKYLSVFRVRKVSGSRIKVFFKRGGGVKSRPLRKKELFLISKKNPENLIVGTKLDNLSGQATKKELYFFCGFPYYKAKITRDIYYF